VEPPAAAEPGRWRTCELGSLIRGTCGAVAELEGQPAVAKALVEGRLTVHGWYYDILSGRIEQYDEQMRRFLPLVG